MEQRHNREAWRPAKPKASSAGLIEESHDRRRLTPQAVTHLDWHNDMSELILDINERIDAAADERARGVIIRKLRRTLDELN